MTQTTAFSAEDHLSASSEGWDVFAVDSNEDDLQIQKVDEQNIFGSDDAAWDFVIQKAISGSKFHQRTIAFIKQKSPDEYDKFINDAVVKMDDGKIMLLFDNGEGVSFSSFDDAEKARNIYRKAVSLG